VIGFRLPPARAAIKYFHCKVGRVRYAHARKRNIRRVIAQSPKGGRRRAAGTRVNLVIGRR
jgi:hypothetical protein